MALDLGRWRVGFTNAESWVCVVEIHHSWVTDSLGALNERGRVVQIILDIFL